MSYNCVLLVDEMYLQQSVQHHSGDFVGEDKEGNIYKGIVVFMIFPLKQSIPYVVKLRPEVSINGEWLKKEINKCVLNSKETGFKVCAAIADNHSANVNAFLHFLSKSEKALTFVE